MPETSQQTDPPEPAAPALSAAFKIDRTTWLWLGFLLLFGGFLRLFRSHKQLLLDDEWHALNAVQFHDQGWILTHLGHADHSIPLTLLYEGFSQTVGLSEWLMRSPSLLAGCAGLLILPWLFRPWLHRREWLLCTALLAMSPLLINYSRIARPYALLALLTPAAIILAWRWGQQHQRADAAGWVLCTVLAAWLNPVSLALTSAPFLWFGASAVAQAINQRHWTALLSLAGVGLAMLLPLTLLLYPPLAADWASLAVKSGVHGVGTETLVVAWGLFAGSGHTGMAVLMLGLVLTGWWVLLQRDRAFSMYLLVIALAALTAVSLTGAEWINQGLVLARYLIGLLPIMLLLAAIGLARLCALLHARFRLADRTLVAAALLLGLYFTGPLPDTHAGLNQFTHHMSQQFDYRNSRNPFYGALLKVEVPHFYAEIASLHPQGNAVLVEAPWHLESNWNAMPRYQATHRQQVKAGFVGGLCAGPLYGEVSVAEAGINLRNFVALEELLNGRQRADYLILRRHSLPGARPIEFDFEQCRRAIEQVFGPAWRDTEDALVFRLSGGS